MAHGFGRPRGILLLREGVVVLFVGPGARHSDDSSLAATQQVVIDELTAVVGVGAWMGKGKPLRDGKGASSTAFRSLIGTVATRFPRQEVVAIADQIEKRLPKEAHQLQPKRLRGSAQEKGLP